MSECPVCKGKKYEKYNEEDQHYEEVHGHFTVDGGDYYHPQIYTIGIYRCKSCGDIFSDK